MALPFVPLADVEEAFDDVMETLDERCLEVASYIEHTYVRGYPRRGRRRAIPPTFPPPVWNVHQQVVLDQHRTNNVVEGFHSKFQKCIVTHHANIWKFIETLKKEEQEGRQLRVQIRAGHTKIRQPINKKYILSQQRVKNIVTRYQEFKDRNEILVYLRNLSYNLKLQQMKKITRK